MRIYSMTATFGKLEHQTLTLEPGLNVISAPNEWGKTTWCAFLVAMLYGIDTRERSKQGSLADKERYAPWSGSPMSGRIDLNWNGRDISIERSTRGRTVFGDFKAYETDTGLSVPELTATGCGETLLGVEKSVFTRAGFIRLTDMPVSEDDALRRRLNALVTTGDESGASDALEQKLRDLKNRCRHNKTGRLPQLEAQRNILMGKLEQLQQLQTQNQHITGRQDTTSQQIRLLENHLTALAYKAAQEDARRVDAADEACRQAQQRYEAQTALCEDLPTRDVIQENILQLEQLRLQQSEVLPSPPQKPEAPTAFAGMTPEQALQQATADKDTYDKLFRFPLFLILSILFVLNGGIVLLLADWKFSLPFLLLAGAFLAAHVRKKVVLRRKRKALTDRYPGLTPDLWVQTARDYQNQVAAYGQRQAAHSAMLEQGERLDSWRKTLSMHDALENARLSWEQAKAHAEAVSLMAKAAHPPAFTDTLTFSAEDTRQRLAQATAEHHQLHLQQGHILGQMEALGQETTLQQQLDDLQKRIGQLEDVYTAVTIALETLSEASDALQRKFAPRISQRAQALFAQLTGNRYDRLLLEEDLRVRTGAKDDDVLRSDLWRSDGTADQLYLALRLAVAEELTPHTPLVLDDALVRFDDSRLANAMAALTEAAQNKQVILFTCQSREENYL